MSEPYQLTNDERAAVRAFLQRCEVRLSTLHRVASALLSGAGVMVLLPPLAQNSIVTAISTLAEGTIDAVRAMLIAAALGALALPMVAFWLLIRDLTRFYFHAHHLRSGVEQLFLPRFTLTGLRLPSDELGPAAEAALDAARTAPETVELIVPPNPVGRAKLDRRLAGYGFDAGESDAARAEALFEFAAAQPRTLIEEVAKIEAGMVRHLQRLQAIVLRYTKALLAFVFTALAVFAITAIEGDGSETVDLLGQVDTLSPVDEVWIAAILAVWSAGIAIAVTAPVRWVEQLLRSEGATRSGVANDPELTRVERIGTWIGLGVWILSLAAIYTTIAVEDVSGRHIVASSALAAVSGATLAWHLSRLWSARTPG